MNSSNPIDHALAAIASIRDRSDSPAEPEPAPIEETPPAPQVLQPPPVLIEPDGYSKAGPGPMEAIRFRWTVRRDGDNAYYVDESIGETTAVVSAGPMSGEAAIKLVDDREDDARRQFETLKREMTGHAAVETVRDEPNAT